MTLVIENPETIQRIEQQVAATGKTADEIVAEAILTLPPVSTYGPLPEEQKVIAVHALRELREAYQRHRDPNDYRTPDEIVGYDEHGLPS